MKSVVRRSVFFGPKALIGGEHQVEVDPVIYRAFFFFSSRRRHTRFDCDWSSDVCSSDLVTMLRDVHALARTGLPLRSSTLNAAIVPTLVSPLVSGNFAFGCFGPHTGASTQIGRASCRERV